MLVVLVGLTASGPLFQFMSFDPAKIAPSSELVCPLGGVIVFVVMPDQRQIISLGLLIGLGRSLASLGDREAARRFILPANRSVGTSKANGVISSSRLPSVHHSNWSTAFIDFIIFADQLILSSHSLYARSIPPFACVTLGRRLF